MNQSKKRTEKTIYLPFEKEKYLSIVSDPKAFRGELDRLFKIYPDIFPPGTSKGYLMKDKRESGKLGIVIRRIKIGNTSWSILPSFVMPHMTAFCDDVEKALFLRKFAVPFWGLAHCFGKSTQFWFELEQRVGGNSILKTTVQNADHLPDHILADEKHTRLCGEKEYIATVVAKECFLTTSLADSAGTDDLKKAYGDFKSDAQELDSEYAPKSVNLDGWQATRAAFEFLFPHIVIIQCFLHVFIGIRDRFKKKLNRDFPDLATKLWDCYRAESKSSFSQRVRRFLEWLKKIEAPLLLIEKAEKLRKRKKFYLNGYSHEASHRTGNMLDRLMLLMDRHLFRTKYFHGSSIAANKSMKAWALIFNFAPSNPTTIKKYGTFKSPAERLNGFSYHDNWLENLLISASAGRLRSCSP